MLILLTGGSIVLVGLFLTVAVVGVVLPPDTTALWEDEDQAAWLAERRRRRSR